MDNGKRVSGVTLGKMNDDDYGLIKITTEGTYPFAPMGKSKDMKEGTPCIATGHPGGYQSGRPPVVRFGTFLNATRNALRTTCVIEQGDSGGPLFNLDGLVIGIHSRISSGQSQNFHIPIDFYTDSWDRLLAGKEWPAGIGIRGEDGTQDGTKGCTVLSLESEMGAAKAGIQVGDLITSANATQVEGIRDLQAALSKSSDGDEVEVELLRDSKKVAMKVKLGALR
jgi:serine protease Do